MKYDISTINKITITDIKQLDPIEVYLENFDKGQGKLTISCFNASWSYYWGAMGDEDLMEFFLGADNRYLSEKLNPLVESTVDNVDDLESYAKKHIRELRKNKEIDPKRARALYHKSSVLTMYKDINNTKYIEIMTEIFGSDWYYCLPKKPNPKYQYFCRILDAIKETFKIMANERIKI